MEKQNEKRKFTVSTFKELVIIIAGILTILATMLGGVSAWYRQHIFAITDRLHKIENVNIELLNTVKHNKQEIEWLKNKVFR